MATRARLSVAGQGRPYSRPAVGAVDTVRPAACNSPLHTGGGAVHTPEAVHRTSSGPTRTDPSSQRKLQLDWRGQRMLPRSGGRRGGHGVAGNKHRPWHEHLGSRGHVSSWVPSQRDGGSRGMGGGLGGIFVSCLERSKRPYFSFTFLEQQGETIK